MSIKAKEFHNHKCIKCHRVCVKMVSMGVLDMCLKCKKEEFGYSGLIDRLTSNYDKWLKIYKEGKVE